MQHDKQSDESNCMIRTALLSHQVESRLPIAFKTPGDVWLLHEHEEPCRQYGAAHCHTAGVQEDALKIQMKNPAATCEGLHVACDK